MDPDLAVMRNTARPTAERRAAFRARNKRLLEEGHPPQDHFRYGVPGRGIAIDCGLCVWSSGAWPDDGSAEENFHHHSKIHVTKED